MKSKAIFIFGLSLAILTSNLPVLAQVRRTVQSLPNGNYFYGRSTQPDRTDVDYLVFRKTGNAIVGLSYRYREEGYCFRGTVNGNMINNVTREYVELGLGERREFRRVNPINLGNFNRLNFNRIPNDSNARPRLQQCVRVFANRR